MEVGENYKKGSWNKDGEVESENTCGKGRCSRYDECRDLYMYKGFDVSVIKCFYYEVFAFSLLVWLNPSLWTP